MVTGLKPLSELQPSAACLAVVKDFESFYDKAYVCPAGVLTIGYGSTWNFRNGRGVKPGDTTTKEEAENELARDLQVAVNDIKRILPAGIQLNQGQYDALVSFAFNMGGPNFSKSRVAAALRRGDFDAAAEGFKAHVTGNGKRLNGLVRRREAESELFKTGIPTDGRGNTLATSGDYQAPQSTTSANSEPDPGRVDPVAMSWIELAIRQGKTIPDMPATQQVPEGAAGAQFGATFANLAPPTQLMGAISNATNRYIDVRYSQQTLDPNKGWTDCSHFVRYVMDKYLGLDMGWCYAGLMARKYSEKFNLPFNTIPSGQITADKLPLFGVVSLQRYSQPGVTNNHVVFLTVENGKRYVCHSTSGRGSDGRTGVDKVPLERYLDDFNRQRYGIEIADLTGYITGHHQEGRIGMGANDGQRWRGAGAPNLDADFKSSVLRDAIVMNGLGMATTQDNMILLNGMSFKLGFDDNLNANTQGSNVIQTAANQFLINIPSNMSASWSMFSAISKMAKQAGMDPGQMQVEIAKELIRTKGDDSYFRFLQRTPPEYGFGKYKAMAVPTQAELQQQWMAKQQQNIQKQIEGITPPRAPAAQQYAANPQAEREAAMRQASQNGQAVNFATGGTEAPQGRSATGELNNLLREAHQEFAAENPELSRYYQNRILVVEGTPLSRNMLNGNGGSVEIIGVQPGMTKDDVKEMLAGRAVMAQAMQAQNTQAENVTLFRPLTPVS